MIMFTTDTMKYFNIHEFPFRMLLISCHKYHKVNAKKHHPLPSNALFQYCCLYAN